MDSLLGQDVAEVKARTVTALQTASADSVHGPALKEILDKSDVWATYSGQRHDLFLTSAPVVGLLTAGSGSVAGLLTETAHVAPLSDTPPDLL